MTARRETGDAAVPWEPGEGGAPLRIVVRRRLQASDGPMDLEVDLSVDPGGTVALFGASGAGKSSVLRMVAGLLRPDEGRITCGDAVWFDSRAGIDLPPWERRAGLYFQDYALFPHMTACENVAYAIDGPDRKRRALRWLARFGLEELAARRPHQLSGGQCQRIALARLLAARPRALLLDEPLSALDPAMRSGLQDELDSFLAESGLPAVIVSHDLPEVWRLADRVALLERGRIRRTGTPAEVLAPAAGTSPRLQMAGTVLSMEPADGLVVLTAAAGGSVFKAVLSVQEAGALRIGGPVLLAAKAFEIFAFPMGERGLEARAEGSRSEAT